MQQYDVILLGGLSGRLDQTVHTLSYLHKLRKVRERVFAITDENIGWVLQEVCDLAARHALPFAQALCKGEHFIHVDHSLFGPTCSLLPVGIDFTVLSTTGLRWNLSLNTLLHWIWMCS